MTTPINSKGELIELFVHLGIYVRNDHGAVRRTIDDSVGIMD